MGYWSLGGSRFARCQPYRPPPLDWKWRSEIYSRDNYLSHTALAFSSPLQPLLPDFPRLLPNFCKFLTSTTLLAMKFWNPKPVLLLVKARKCIPKHF